MKRRIYLHIGVEKTGSTTLQAVGNTNRDLLRQRGILYPSSPGLTNHTGLAIYASTGSTLKDVRQIAGLGSEQEFAAFQARFPDQLRREVEESGCERVWLSNEHLSSRVRKPAEITRLLHLLRPLADDIRVVVYIRNQPDLLVSSYSTKIRSGGTRELALPKSEKDYYYNFAIMLQRWSAVFGKDRMQVRIFDRAVLKAGDVTADFFDVLGEVLQSGIALPVGLNESLDAHALQFVRLFNTHVPRLTGSGLNPDYGQISTVIAAASNGPKLRPPTTFMQSVAAMFEESNRHVAERYFGNAGPLFAPQDYRNVEETLPLSVSDAQALGVAALAALDAQVGNVEDRLLTTSGHLPVGAAYADRASVLQAETVEGVVAATALLWQARQQRLTQLRSALRGKRMTKAGLGQEHSKSV